MPDAVTPGPNDVRVAGAEALNALRAPDAGGLERLSSEDLLRLAKQHRLEPLAGEALAVFWQREQSRISRWAHVLAGKMTPPGCSQQELHDGLMDHIADVVVVNAKILDIEAEQAWPTFLYRSAAHRAVDLYRRYVRRPREIDEQPAEAEADRGSTSEVGDRALVSSAPSSEDVMIDAEFAEVVAMALDELAESRPDGYKLAFALRHRYMEGHTVPETARAMGVSERQVLRYLKNGATVLRTILRERRGIENSADLKGWN